MEEGTSAGFGAVRAWASLVLTEMGLRVEEGVRPYGPPLRDFPGQGQSACSLTVIQPPAPLAALTGVCGGRLSPGAGGEACGDRA